MVSAHWEAPVPTVTTSPRPPILYDYYNFPPASYELTWPAPGEPELAARVCRLLTDAGLETDSDPDRGFDHGTFIPLKVTYPDANIPTIQLSLVDDLDPVKHLAIGRALQPLRDEGVFIVGSGMSYHNMAAMRGGGAGLCDSFHRWLCDLAELPAAERDERLVDWASAPGAREAHPREEHLLPLMVVAGAAGEDRARIGMDGSFVDVRIAALHFG